MKLQEKLHLHVSEKVCKGKLKFADTVWKKIQILEDASWNKHKTRWTFAADSAAKKKHSQTELLFRCLLKKICITALSRHVENMT